MRKPILTYGSFLFFLFYILPAQAQIVDDNGFFKGTFVEAGIQPSGAFGSLVKAPSDYISATASKHEGRVGFIADAGKDGWAKGSPNFIGDFFVPGDPYEAFSIKMNGSLFENAGNSDPEITGSVSGFSDDGTTSAIEWTGAKNNLQIRQVTSVGKNSSYILIKVFLKNTGSTTINNVYYTRSVDPDNEVDEGGQYSTLNTIEEQNPGTTSTALVSGKGIDFNSYLGLGSRDCRARVAVMSSFSSDGESIFNGTGEVVLKTKGSHNTKDNAIAVAFKLGNLAPGDSTTLAMAYVLNAVDLPPAMDETDPLFNVKADSYASGSVINVCSGSAAQLNIINGDGYTWTWSPSTGLNQTTGRSVNATLTGDIVYTASGVNTCGTSRSINLSLHPVIAISPDAAGAITASSTVYQGWNATFTVPPIANATTYKWTIPAGASFISGYGTNSVVVKFGTGAISGAVTVHGENSCGSGATSSFNVTLNTGSSLAISSTNSGVPGGADFTTPTVIDDQINITGTESITNTRVYIDGGFQSGDQLSYDGDLPSGVTVAYSSTTGGLSFTGTATPAEWKAIFNAVKFKSTSTNTADRSIKFVLGDKVSLLVNGKSHYYEYIIPSSTPSWTDAYAAAAGRTFFGLAGYLATISSSTENNFVKQKLSTDGWIGGSDAYQMINAVKGSTYTAQSQTEGAWYWVNGPEAGTPISTGNTSPVVASGGYMNWAPNEPNNAGDENYTQFYSTMDGKWNDLAGTATASVPGYVVEYGGFSSDPAINIEYSRTIKNKPSAPVITSITSDSGPDSHDFITSDKTIKISGTAIANSTVKVTRTGTGVIGTVTADASGNWTYDYTGTTLTEASYTFTATATVSTVVSNASAAITVKVDATAPAKPGAPALQSGSENHTTEEKPTFTGTAEAGASVALYDGTTLITTVVADGSGNYTIPTTTAISEGVHTLTVKATDLAGNISVSSSVFSLTVDRTAPVKPAAPAMTDGDGTKSNNNLPSINGSTEPNAVVKIYNGTDLVTTVTANGSGEWTYTFTNALEDGEYTITTTSTDGVNNISEPSEALSITIDTEKPATSAAPVLETDNNDGHVKINNPIISGVAEPNSKVSIYDGTELVTEITADGAGNWFYVFSPVLTDDTHEISTTNTDATGNTSDAGAVLNIYVDTQVPEKPSTPELNDGNDGNTNSTTPTVSGIAEPNSTVTVYSNGTPVGTATADGSGNWSYTFSPALSDGEYEITTTATDDAGNTGTPSDALKIIVDTAKPTVPDAPVLSDGKDGYINSGTPTVTGTAEPNSTVTVYSNSSPVGTATADGSGNWSYTFSPALSDATYSVSITSKDAAGNTSDMSEAISVIVDTHNPATASAPSLETDNNEGHVKINNPIISGVAEPHSKVSIYDGTELVTEITADGAGNWFYVFSPVLTDDTHEISTTNTDAAGNISDAGSVLNIYVDTQVPEKPSTPELNGGNDGNINSNTPTVSGIAEPNSTVTVYSNGTPVATVTADGSGNWSYTFSPALSDGEYEITTTATDAAGNTGAPSDALSINVDTQKPVAPSVPVLSDGRDGYINSGTPTVTGTAEPNSTVTVYSNGSPVGTATADGSGNWSYTFSPAIADDTYSINVTATDAAGNISDMGEAISIIVDTHKPATSSAPLLETDNNEGHVKINNPIISGVAEPHSKVSIYDGTTLVTEITADGAGNWFYVFSPALTDGTHEISTTNTDAAGNTSDAGSVLNIYVDTNPPAKPGTAQLNNGNDGSTNSTTPNLSGIAEPNSTVTIYSNGTPVATVTADGSGNWSYTFSPALSDGEYQITTTATDAAGNTGAPSDALKITVDTAKPTVPEGSSLKDGRDGRINTSTPTVGGNAEPGSTITVYNNGSPAGTAVVDESGKWSYTFNPALSDGDYNIYTTATDKAGNTSDNGETFSIIVDTKLPVTPGTPEIGGGNNNGHLKTGTPSISGRAEPGSTITVYDNGVPVGTVIADESGQWSYTFNPALTDGNHTITTAITDLAGNISLQSPGYSFGVDTRLPSVSLKTEHTRATGPFTVTFTFSEPVTGFGLSGLQAGNAKVSDFKAISATEYTAVVTPMYDNDKVTLSVNQGAAQDVAGNGNTVSSLMKITADYSGEVDDVYPNPASSVLNVHFKGVTSEKGRVLLIKMSGQVVYDNQISFQNSNLTINVSRFPSGQYILLVKTNNYIHRTNVLIAR